MTNNPFKKIRKFALKDSASSDWIRWIAFAYNVGVFPALVGVWTAQYSELIKHGSIFFFGFVAVFTAIALMFAVVQWIGSSSASRLYFEAEKIKRKYKRNQKKLALAKSDLAYLSLFQEYATSWPNIISIWARRKISKTEEYEELIAQIMGPIVDTREDLFGFSSSEHHNFAVYIYDKHRGILYQVWREKHRHHSSQSVKGREWKPGQGHVGKAFADRSTKITTDAMDPQVYALMEAADDLRKSYDNHAYRSYASIPIGPLGSSADPLGVLVATSNVPDRFDKGNALVLRLAAAVLANSIDLAQNGDAVIPKGSQHIDSPDVNNT